jgi:hypothetical protein
MPFTIRAYLFIFLLTQWLCSCVEKANLTQKPEIDTGMALTPNIVATRTDTAQFDIDKGVLSEKIQTLDVSFAAISCPCAQWFETSQLKSTDNRTYIFLEPSNNKIINADTLFDGNNLPVRILLTGQFYQKKGYPKNYRPVKGDPKIEKVFRYTKLKIVTQGPNYK